MAYVRRRGNQISIVAGERHPTTRKVEQRVLFTFYSRAEAIEMLGRGAPGGDARFEELLAREHPGVRFDWAALRRAVAADLDHLPVAYGRRAEPARRPLQEDLATLVRALVSAPAAEIEEQRAAIEVLRDLLDLRLAAPGAGAPERGEDAPPFAFRFPSRAAIVPSDARAHALALWHRRDLARAEAAIRALTGTAPRWIEGRTLLAQVALARGDVEVAERRAREAVDVARGLVPRSGAREALARDPRATAARAAARTLVAAVARAGRTDEAAALARRLGRDHGDPEGACACEAALALDRGDAGAALATLAASGARAPEHRLLEAFARHELGDRRAALGALLEGALAAPLVARALLGATPGPEPHTDAERDDADAGFRLRALLHGYLAAEASRAPAHFARVLADPRVDKTLADMTGLRAAWYADTRKSPEYLADLTRTQAAAFARTLLRRVPDLADREG